MASSSLWFISTCVFFFCLTSLAMCSSDDAYKVQVGLYYESLCPGCQQFILDDLAKVVFEEDFKDFLDIIDLKFVPYGNAKTFSNGTTICQHGPKECALNIVEACAIHEWPNIKKHFMFIHCVEDALMRGMEWEECYDLPGFESKPIVDCSTTELGKNLQKQHANATENLRPPHSYVPWLTVDEKPLEDKFEHFIEFVCKAYKGKAVPKVCKTQSFPASMVKVKENLINQVSFVEDTYSEKSARATKGMHDSKLPNLV